jgi:hypothetical protein
MAIRHGWRLPIAQPTTPAPAPNDRKDNHAGEH